MAFKDGVCIQANNNGRSRSHMTIERRRPSEKERKNSIGNFKDSDSPALPFAERNIKINCRFQPNFKRKIKKKKNKKRKFGESTLQTHKHFLNRKKKKKKLEDVFSIN